MKSTANPAYAKKPVVPAVSTSSAALAKLKAKNVHHVALIHDPMITGTSRPSREPVSMSRPAAMITTPQEGGAPGILRAVEKLGPSHLARGDTRMFSP